MKISIDQRILGIFPSITIGVVVGKIERSLPGINEKIQRFQEEAIGCIKGIFSETNVIAEHPNIMAWREAYQKFGVKAKKHNPTHETLTRRLLKGERWPSINHIVDIYLTNQTVHLVPHGGYDIASLSGDICLTISPGEEVFEPIGGGNESTNSGEIVYKDSARVLTRRWNYRDCNTTKITETTTKFILMLESPSPEITGDSIKEATRDLICRYQLCYVGSFISHIITSAHSEIEVE
jgi:DNA/RNA-binding domain of Phe-tRNA-synthetase-like protein